jgi:hypothetical protein
VKFFPVLLLILVMASSGCHPGPVINSGPKPPSTGTIAGIVSTDTDAAIQGRKVTVTEAQTGTRYEATTGANGGYTIKVPEGTYRIEVELQAGESVLKQPAETRVQRSDLDPRRDFVITRR